MTAPQSSLSALPSEILTLIFIQANLQDEAYQEAENDYRRRREPFLQMRLKGPSWKRRYGQSVLALGSTCKQLRTLAEPFLFKTLRVSLTQSTVFHVYILKRYASTFTTLELDSFHDAVAAKWGEEKEDDEMGPDEAAYRMEARQLPFVKDFVESTLPHLSNIQVLNCRDESVTDQLFGLLPTLPQSRWYDDDTREEALLKETVRTLARTVCRITIGSSGQWSSQASLSARFPGLQEVSVSGWRRPELELADVPELVNLSSLSYRLRATWSGPNHSLPLSWNSIRPNLRTLALDIPFVFDNEWKFISQSSSTLVYLSLAFRQWKADSETPPLIFPRLQQLTLHSETPHVTSALARIAPPATLATLEVALPKREGLAAYRALFNAVRPFSTPFTAFRIVQIYVGIPEGICSEFEDFVRATRFGGGSTITSPATWQNWTGGRKVVGELEYAPVTAADAVALLEYMAEQVKQADRAGDQVEVQDWVRWLEPLSGRSSLNLH